ncbi:MAG: hypothetical protein MRZ79_22290 [Bacteroidia bacterium]|nr:hypothetical protein [Bacteroidia bacterium]
MNKLYVFFMMVATLMMAVPAFAGQASATAPAKTEFKPTKKELRAQKKEFRKAVRKAIFNKKKDGKELDPTLKKGLVWLGIGVALGIVTTILSFLGPLAILGLLTGLASFIAGCVGLFIIIKWLIEEA